MATIQDVRDKLTRTIKAVSKPDELRGRIGYMSGTRRVIDVPGIPNKVYVTLEDNSRTTVVQAIHVSSARTWNMPVILKRLPSGEYYIDSPDIGAALAVMQNLAPGMFVPPHSHRFGLGLPDYVEGLRFEPLALKRGRDQSLSIRVEPGNYELYGRQVYFPGDEIDLTLYQPSSTEHCWVKIGIDIADNQLTAVAGDPVDLATRLLDEDLANLDLGVYPPLGGYDLSGAETSIGSILKFRDCRNWLTAGTQKSGVYGTIANTNSARAILYRKASDNKWYTASNNTTGPVAFGPERGFLVAPTTESNATGIIHTGGLLGGFTGLTAGDPVYLHSSGYTQTKPTPSSGGGQVILLKLGIAITTTTIMVTPGAAYFLKRASLANGGTLTVEHYDDTTPYVRKAFAYVAGSPDMPKDIDDWNSAQACVLVRYDDGSGSNGSTKTTFKNNTGSTISDLVVGVELS